MAFGIERKELVEWKKKVSDGEITFLTHYWIDERFPNCTTVTKVGCCDIDKLINWGKKHNLKAEWIDKRSKFPHFDLLGSKQREILINENLTNHLKRFNI
jgi:hypothetical protein